MSGGFKNRQENPEELTAEELLWVQSGAAGVVLLEYQGSSPAPTAGFGKLYAKTDDHVYFMDEAGTEYDLTVGSTQTTEVPTGTVNDSNQAFVFTKKPFLIVMNHMTYRENSGWTWSGSTATVVFPIGTGGDIYGIMQ